MNIEETIPPWRPRRKCLPIRILELLLCTACFCLSLAVLMMGTSSYTVMIVLSMLVMISFCLMLVCYIDIITGCQKFPIMWNSWIIIATAGCVLFFFGAGLILLRQIELQYILLALFIFTGIVFLMEIIFWLQWLLKLQKTSARIQPAESSIMASKSSRMSISRIESEISERGDYISSPMIMRPQKHPCICPPETMSYGGTFHVSKDVAPMPSPTTRDIETICRSPQPQTRDMVTEPIPEVKQVTKTEKQIVQTEFDGPCSCCGQMYPHLAVIQDSSPTPQKTKKSYSCYPGAKGRKVAQRASFSQTAPLTKVAQEQVSIVCEICGCKCHSGFPCKCVGGPTVVYAKEATPSSTPKSCGHCGCKCAYTMPTVNEEVMVPELYEVSTASRQKEVRTVICPMWQKPEPIHLKRVEVIEHSPKEEKEIQTSNVVMKEAKAGVSTKKVEDHHVTQTSETRVITAKELEMFQMLRRKESPKNEKLYNV